MKLHHFAIAATLMLFGCAEPDEKLNADPNNTSNVAPNNTSNADPNNAPGPIDPGDYDQSCEFEDDCALIHVGEPCECKVCFGGSINVNDLSAYQDDVAAAMCPDISCPAIGCGEDQLAHCNAGTCEVRNAEYVSADDFDRACSSPDDCVAVFEGEICAPCQGCANTAINAADAEEYASLFRLDCQHRADCACAQPVVDCVEGRCELVE